jgi:hypothetical protein
VGPGASETRLCLSIQGVADRRMAGDFSANPNGESDPAEELVSLLVFVRVGKFYQSESNRCPIWLGGHWFADQRSAEPNESLVSTDSCCNVALVVVRSACGS